MKVIKHLTLFLLLTVTVNAQNIMTSSPYSMFGIGEIVTGLYGSNSAMGGYRQVCAAPGCSIRKIRLA